MLGYNACRYTSACAITICILVFSSSCKKDKLESSDCIPIPSYNGSGFGYISVSDSVNYSLPCYNPNNANEIIFVKNSNSGNELIKLNIVTNQKQVIYSGTIFSQPKWGKNDWILLNLPDANIWKIKSNGDSLQQLTNNGNFFQPEWSPNQSRIIFYDSNTPFNYYISDLYGTLIDSFPDNPPTIIRWNNDSLIYFQYQFKIYSLNLFSRNKCVINQYSDNTPADRGIIITYNNDLIFCKTDGIYSINLNSLNIRKIKSTCNSRTYLFPSYSPISDKIIFQRTDETLIDENTIYVIKRLYIMNSDGSDEKIIEIPNN